MGPHLYCAPVKFAVQPDCSIPAILPDTTYSPSEAAAPGSG